VQANNCVASIDIPAYGFKTFIPTRNWTAPQPSVTTFSPGHDSRIFANGSTDLVISLDFDAVMDCDSVTTSTTVNGTNHRSIAPFIDVSSIVCEIPATNAKSTISAATQSVWRWSAQLRNVTDGIYQVTVDDPRAAVGTSGTGVGGSCDPHTDHLGHGHLSDQEGILE
jgi:alpha-1,3-glucan synthase